MKISVAICTYNGELFLEKQIESILNQTHKVDEIVICDDISKDSTLEILEKYKRQNPNLFKIHVNEINLKSVKNFEKTISLCTGDLIFLSDQDDVWEETKVAKFYSFFSKNPQIKVLASNGFSIDENDLKESKYSVWDIPDFFTEKRTEFNYYEIITLVANIATGASMAFKSDFINQILPFPGIKNFHHDEWIALQSAYSSSFGFLNEKLFSYRIHKNQQVGGVFKEKTIKNKLFLIDFFNLNNSKISFKIFRKRLRKIHVFATLNWQLFDSKNIDKNQFEFNETLYSNQINKLKKNIKKSNIFVYFYYKLNKKFNLKT